MSVSPSSKATTSPNWTDAFARTFFTQSKSFAAVLSLGGEILDITTAALDSGGYSRPEIIGKVFWETPWWRLSPEIRTKIKKGFAAALGGTPFKSEVPSITSKGSQRWIELQLYEISTQSGQVTGVMVEGIDTTLDRGAETELSIARKRVESALIAADIGTYQWDIGSDRLHADRNLAELFGVTTDDDGSLPLSGFVARIHPNDQERVMKEVRHSVETGENFESEYRITLPQGERWVNSRGRMMLDENGRAVEFLGLVMDISQRKRAESERAAIAIRLQQWTAIHETVLSGITDFAYVFDLQGRFLYANRPLLKLYGRSLDEVVGRTFSQLGYPAWHAELHLREIAQVISTKKPLQAEVPFRGESGISGIFDYIFTPVIGADGRVEAVAGTTRDVTERKRGAVRDRLLVDLDDATRTLVEPEDITQTSARLVGEYLGVNRCAYADVEADENTFNLTGDFNRDVPSIVGRYRFDQFGDECLRMMRLGEPYIVSDSEIDDRTASVRDAYRATQIRSVICVPLRKGGKFVAAMAVHQNIPREWLQTDVEALQLVANRCWESIERARVLRTLEVSEQRLRLAVVTGRLGVWEVDLATKALSASPQCRSIYGLPEGPLAFDQMLALMPADDRKRLESEINRATKENSEFALEHRAILPDGRERWVLVRAQPANAIDGTPVRVIGASLDITPRKEAERERERLRDEAVRASRAKDDFLATLSHELRTPLNPVLLLASESARDPELSASARETFAVIRKNVELEARLIDDLLDLTSIVRGKLILKTKDLDLHTVLEDALRAVRPDFDAKSITVEYRRCEMPFSIHGDEARLAQVFMNLLKNAAKFTPDGGKVSLGVAYADSDIATVRLTDTGIGMNAEELSRVFEAFAQGDHANEPGNNRFGGLGLGLAIARRVVELHGGRIEAVSDGRTKGTTFIVTLPKAAPHRLLSSVKGDGEVSSKPRARSLRILVVEDHPSTRAALAQLLSRRKHMVTTAGSLAEAKTCADSAGFDVLVSDLGLPDGDGTEIMTYVRDRYTFPGIAMTGFGMSEDISRCYRAGFSDHLTKPVTVEALEAAIDKVTESRR